MKWLNHQIVTGFIVYAATDNALFVASSIVGAVIPDRVEGSPPSESREYWAWRKRHRTWSHYPVIYLALIAALLAAKEFLIVPNMQFASTLSLVADVATYVLVGALLHIVEDSICGKVPVFTPTSKHGVKLFTVGSWQEYFFSAIIVIACLFARFGSLDEIIAFVDTLKH